MAVMLIGEKKTNTKTNQQPNTSCGTDALVWKPEEEDGELGGSASYKMWMLWDA